MIRAALYARFSTDMQNPRSADDQLVECRALAERLGAVVVDEFKDEAISGRHDNRPGRNAMLAAAAGRPRPFDLVIAESINRLARSGGGTFDAYEDLKALGVRIHTLEQGAVDLTRTAVEALKSALTMEEFGAKVRRGHRAVVRDGRKVGRPPYGYRAVLAHDARGDRIRGLIEIDEAQAEVVRRIGLAFLDGAAMVGLSHQLNAEGVAAPTGRGWTYNAILGRQGRGILRNPIYGGVVAYGRVQELLDRRTGRRRALDQPRDQWTQREAPELAIFDPDTWAAIQARLAAKSALVRRAGNPSAANAPKRLFTGLVRCGVCGGKLHTTGPDRRYRCWTRMTKGPTHCANGRTAQADKFEAEALDALRRDLLHPAAVELFVREYHKAQRLKAAAAAGERAQLARQAQEARQRAERLVDQVAAGHLKGATVQAKLAQLEQQAADADAALAKLEAALARGQVVPIDPDGAARRYRELVEDLQAAIAKGPPQAGPKLESAREGLHQVVRAIYLDPGPQRGKWTARVDADLTALLEHAPTPAKPARRA